MVTQLVPVKDWVYDLFEVYYRTEEAGSVVLGPVYVCSSCENHLLSDIMERWPTDAAKWYDYNRVAENVGHPRSVGSFYGQPISESAWEHGRREAAKRGLTETR